MPDRPSFPIPENPTPETCCLQIVMPNDPTWKAVIAGLLFQPAEWFNWQRDEAKTGKVLAQYWREIYANIDWTDMSCCCEQTIPVIYRINPENDLDPQISYDGGTTWISNPSNPVYGIPTMPPPVNEDTTKCDAAQNGSAHFDDLIAAQSAKFATAATAIDFTIQLVGVLLAAVFAPAALPILIPVFIVTMSALFAFGQTAFDAYWDVDNKRVVFCAIVCHIKDDGTFDEPAFNGFLSEFAANLPPSIAKDAMYRQLQYIGYVGLSNLCSYGAASSSDCSECACPTTEVWFIVGDGTTTELQLPDEGTENQYTIPAILYGGVYYWYQWFVNLPSFPDGTGAIYQSIEVTSGSYSTRGQYNKDTGAISVNWPGSDACSGGIYAESAVPFTVKIIVNPCP